MRSPEICDALIAGGGLAGALLGIRLAHAGRETVVIEKSQTAEHKVCGEFLSPEVLSILREAGVDAEALGAQTIHTVRLAGQDVHAEVRLPAPGLSLTRRKLDEALLQRAAQAGARVLRGATVEQLVQEADPGAPARWQGRLSRTGMESSVLHAHEAFLATGKHDLRGWARAAGNTQNDLIAFKMYFTLAPSQHAALSGHVELVVYPGGYAGLQPVEDGQANLCALITRRQFRSLNNRWENLLDHMQSSSRHLTGRLCGATAALDRPLALSSIPYGYRAARTIPGPWRLGDQMAVIPSFCGEGMAIALHTAVRAAHLYLAGKSAADFHMELRRQLAYPVCCATALSRALVAMPWLTHAVRTWPSLLSGIFRETRLPGAALEPALNIRI